MTALFLFAPSLYAKKAPEALILAEAQSVVWGFDFLPDNKVLLTERDGRPLLFDLKTKSLTPLSGAPKVHSRGQGGLLDVRVHPNFSSNRRIYLSYSEPLKKGSTTSVLYAELDPDKSEIKNATKIFSAEPGNTNNIHYGSRIEFDGQGHIFISVGDRNDRHLSQDKNTHLGKILRLTENGEVPKDNPFAGDANAKAEIWSLGHRNPQGLVYDSASKKLWSAEFGPRGGDELNLILKGKNYGWPVVTFGREYWGPKIGKGTHQAGMEDPVAQWTPSISPSALTIYTGTKYPQWKGQFFLANLASLHVRRLKVEGNKVVEEEELLKGFGRFRNLRTGPDGYLYFSLDDGRFGRLNF